MLSGKTAFFIMPLWMPFTKTKYQVKLLEYRHLVSLN